MKLPLIFALSFAISLQLYSQGTFNLRDRYDFLSCVLSSVYPTDSCYYVTGIIADTLIPYNTGALLMKLDLQGNPLFIKTLKSTSKTYETWFQDVIPADDGGFYVVGYTVDSTQKTLFIRWGHNGDTLLTKEFFSPNYPNGPFITPMGGMTQLANKNLAIINWIDNENASNSDSYMILLDTLGNIINTKVLGTSKQERPMSIEATSTGGMVLGGIRTNTHTNHQNYTYQCEINQLDSMGNVEWNYLSPISLGLRDAANDMLLLNDGSIIVASGLGHEEIHPPLNEVLFDRQVFKLNPQHQLEWELTFPDPFLIYFARTTNLVELTNGTGYVLAGMGPIFAEDPDDPGSIGGFITKISVDGDSVWTRKYLYPMEHVSVHETFDMKETPDGGLIICGQSLDYDDKATYPQQGWLLKLDEHGCLVPGCHLSDATVEGQAPDIKLSIYPNPTTDYLNFYVHAPNPTSGATFRVISAEGRLVKEFETSNLSPTFIVPIWDWPGGVYWLQYCVGGEVIVSKQFQILK